MSVAQRQQVARLLNARAGVLFTRAQRRRTTYQRRTDWVKHGHIITAKTEHKAVLDV